MPDRMDQDQNTIDTGQCDAGQYECQLVQMNSVCPTQSCSLYNLILIGYYVVGQYEWWLVQSSFWFPGGTPTMDNMNLN